MPVPPDDPLASRERPCPARSSLVIKNLGVCDPRETFRRRLAFLGNTRPGLRRMRRRKPVPVVVVDLREVFGNFLVLEDQAGVAVRLDALVRPIVTAEHHNRLVDDDALVVTGGLEAEDV